jgi:F0F1-type ATP synthase membrane subunit b/b'
LVVLVSREEYVRLKLAQADQARSELREALGEARRKVGAAGLDPGVIDEAIAAARRL